MVKPSYKSLMSAGICVGSSENFSLFSNFVKKIFVENTWADIFVGGIRVSAGKLSIFLHADRNAYCRYLKELEFVRHRLAITFSHGRIL